jgi:hypothetical protein
MQSHFASTAREKAEIAKILQFRIVCGFDFVSIAVSERTAVDNYILFPSTRLNDACFINMAAKLRHLLFCSCKQC